VRLFVALEIPSSVRETLVSLLASMRAITKEPRWVRGELYHYRFTSRAERRETGAWWARTPVAMWLPPLALDTSGALTASATGAWRRTPT